MRTLYSSTSDLVPCRSAQRSRHGGRGYPLVDILCFVLFQCGSPVLVPVGYSTVDLRTSATVFISVLGLAGLKLLLARLEAIY
jgi:hypothetical protein